jgi:hypothetical protein
MEVLSSMFVLGVIAAPNTPANQTDSKMHPLVAHLETLFAALGARRNFLNFIEMSTRHVTHNYLALRCRLKSFSHCENRYYRVHVQLASTHALITINHYYRGRLSVALAPGMRQAGFLELHLMRAALSSRFQFIVSATHQCCVIYGNSYACPD